MRVDGFWSLIVINCQSRWRWGGGGWQRPIRFHSLKLEQRRTRWGLWRRRRRLVETAARLSVHFNASCFQRTPGALIFILHFQSSSVGRDDRPWLLRRRVYIMCTHSQGEQECSPICNFPMILIFISSLSLVRRWRRLQWRRRGRGWAVAAN